MGAMDFKVNREQFTATEIILDDGCEQSIEKDFVLPDYYPDIFRILKCRCIPKILSNSINGGKLTFELAVCIRVLYQSEGSCKINCLEQKLTFSKSMDLSGECTNPMVNLSPHTDYVNCRVVNKRRIDVRGAVSTRVRVTGEKNQEIITDAFGSNIQLKKSMITFPVKRLTAAKRITVIEELELGSSKPSVNAVIRSDCVVIQGEQKVIAGKLVTKGDAEISMLYTCQNDGGEDSAEPMRFTIPFSQIIDVDGIDETYQAMVDITPSGCEIIPKGENSTSLECELILLVNVTAMKFDSCEVVTDAYSTCYECELEKTACRLDSVPIQINEMHTQTAEITYEEEPLVCVYDSWCEVTSVSARFDTDKNAHIVSGNINCCIIGKSESSKPVYLELEVPFEHELSADISLKSPCSRFEPNVFIKECSYHLTDSSTVEIKSEICIKGCITDADSKEFLCTIKPCCDKPKEKKCNFALKLCYCSENDDIWEIAKKYSTSIKAILDENDIDGDRLTDSRMLLIPLLN